MTDLIPKKPNEISRRRNFKSRFSSPMSYIEFWMDKQKTTISAKQEITCNGRKIIASSLLEKIELDYDAERRAEFDGKKGAPNVSKLLGKALNQYMESVLFEAISDLRHHLAFDPGLSKLDAIMLWLRAVTGVDDDVNLVVMSHWIWMVKRNLYGRTVKNHIMPIIHGPQGYGKSQAILKLIEPMAQLAGLPDLDQLLDPRMIHSNKDLFVAFIDEMRQAKKVDVDALKNLITTPVRYGRRAYSPMADHMPNVTSLIGATNKDIHDIIKDDTGMRRFFVITAPHRCDWDTINSVDYESLWRSIDEDLDSGYLSKDDLTVAAARPDSVAVRQLAYADKHPALQWVDECYPLPVAGEEPEYVSDTMVLEEVVNFMARSGIKLNLSKNALTRKVGHLFGPKIESRTKAGRTYGWLLNISRYKHSPSPLVHPSYVRFSE